MFWIFQNLFSVSAFIASINGDNVNAKISQSQICKFEGIGVAEFIALLNVYKNRVCETGAGGVVEQVLCLVLDLVQTLNDGLLKQLALGAVGDLLFNIVATVASTLVGKDFSQAGNGGSGLGLGLLTSALG